MVRGGKFGSIEWVLQHKILRRETFSVRDLYAVEVWPPLMQRYFQKQLHDLPGVHDDNHLFDKLCPPEINSLYGFVDSVHVEAVLYVYKKYVYRPSPRVNNLAEFIHGFVEGGQHINKIHPKSGLLSKSFVTWPEDSDQQFNDITKMLSLMRNIVPILHTKRMSMSTDNDFFQWWHGNGNDRAVLLSLHQGWTPPPTEVSDCVRDMLHHTETEFYDHLALTAVDVVLESACETFVATGMEFMLTLCEEERKAGEAEALRLQKEEIRSCLRDLVRRVEEEEQRTTKEIRSCLRDLVRRVEAADPEFQKEQRMKEEAARKAQDVAAEMELACSSAVDLVENLVSEEIIQEHVEMTVQDSVPPRATFSAQIRESKTHSLQRSMSLHVPLSRPPVSIVPKISEQKKSHRRSSSTAIHVPSAMRTSSMPTIKLTSKISESKTSRR